MPTVPPQATPLPGPQREAWAGCGRQAARLEAAWGAGWATSCSAEGPRALLDPPRQHMGTSATHSLPYRISAHMDADSETQPLAAWPLWKAGPACLTLTCRGARALCHSAEVSAPHALHRGFCHISPSVPNPSASCRDGTPSMPRDVPEHPVVTLNPKRTPTLSCHLHPHHQPSRPGPGARPLLPRSHRACPGVAMLAAHAPAPPSSSCSPPGIPGNTGPSDPGGP